MASVLIIGFVFLIILFCAFLLAIMGFMVIDVIKTLSRRLHAPKTKEELKQPDLPPEKIITGKEVYTDDSERIRKQRDFERLRKYADATQATERRTQSGDTAVQDEGDNVGRGPISNAALRSIEQSHLRSSKDGKGFKLNRFSS